MKKEELEEEILNGPNLSDMFRSLERHIDHGVFDVRFEFVKKGTAHSASNSNIADVMIQGMERPRVKGRFWKIRAACGDISKRNADEINVIILYDPNKREGYLSFVNPQPSKLRTE